MDDHCEGRCSNCYRTDDCVCHCHDNFRSTERKELDWNKILKKEPKDG